MGDILLHEIEMSLRSFYIFDSTLSCKDGEENKKILYYYPKDIEMDTKIKDVGLSEAIITFTETFVLEGGCKSLRTLKTTQFFYQIESKLWIVMVINVPKEIRSKDGVEYENYRSDDIQEAIYQHCLQQAYTRFCLQNGTFQMIVDSYGTNKQLGRKELKHHLDIYFDHFLLTLKLPINDIMHFTRTVQYIPLNRFLFLRVHSFLNMLKLTFSQINDIILFFNEHILCGGNLKSVILYTLYEYLLEANIINDTSSNNIKFYLPMENNEWLQFNLYIYRFNGVILFIFIKTSETISSDTVNDLEAYIDGQLSLLSVDIRDQLSNKLTISNIPRNDSEANNIIVPKFLFINEQTLSHLSNLSRKLPSNNSNNFSNVLGQAIPTNIINLLADLIDIPTSSKEFSTLDQIPTTLVPSFQETLIKTTNDFWIVKRQCNWRQFYVVIFNKKATLLDIIAEAERTFEQEITDDVFFEN